MVISKLKKTQKNNKQICHLFKKEIKNIFPAECVPHYLHQYNYFINYQTKIIIKKKKDFWNIINYEIF